VLSLASTSEDPRSPPTDQLVLTTHAYSGPKEQASLSRSSAHVAAMRCDRPGCCNPHIPHPEQVCRHTGTQMAASEHKVYLCQEHIPTQECKVN